VPHFGSWVIDTAIIDKDKASYPGLAIIEDRPEIKDAHRASWVHIVFDQTYNRNSSAPYRLLRWNDPLMLTILQNIEHEKSF
jgi:5'-nucleotidase